VAYLLDTNVLSELVRPTPDAIVVAWARNLPALDQYVSVLTLGEIEKGIALMSTGARRTQLMEWARAALPRQFLGRTLQIEDDIAVTWGQLTAAGKASGRELPVIDGLLVATAKVHGLTLATRNVSDVVNRGVSVFDPWTGVLHP